MGHRRCTCWPTMGRTTPTTWSSWRTWRRLWRSRAPGAPHQGHSHLIQNHTGLGTHLGGSINEGYANSWMFYIYSDGHRLRTCFGKFNINFEPRATLDLEPKTIHLEPLIILNDISLCSIYVLTIIDRLGRWHLEPPNIHTISLVIWKSFLLLVRDHR